MPSEKTVPTKNVPVPKAKKPPRVAAPKPAAKKTAGTPVQLVGGIPRDRIESIARAAANTIAPQSAPPPSPAKKADALVRCPWAREDLARRYHDDEWGVPLHDDRALFEFLVLEGAQAGLSWDTILRKRDQFRAAFDRFDAAAVAQFDKGRIEQLMRDTGIVRNRLKIESAVKNARATRKVREEFGSLDTYLWRFVDGSPRRNAWKSFRQVPAETPESDAMSKDLRKRGFSFVGSTICYAFMQAVGMVNDHLVDCFRYSQVG